MRLWELESDVQARQAAEVEQLERVKGIAAEYGAKVRSTKDVWETAVS